MAQNNESDIVGAVNMGSSPPSGSDHTHYNTPSTNITAVSPEAQTNAGHGNTPAPKLNLRGLSLAARSGSAARIPSRLSLPRTSAAVSLSPTAAEFTPSLRSAVRVTGHGMVTPYSARLPPVTGTHAYGAIGQAIPPRTTITDLAEYQHVYLGAHVNIVVGNFSSEDHTARIFEIAGIPNPDPRDIAAAFPYCDFKSLAQIDSSDMHKGVFRLIFTNIRDARQAFIRAAYSAFPQCTLSFVSPKNFAVTRGDNPANVTNHAAQLLITLAPRRRGLDMVTVAELNSVLSQFGEVYAIYSVTNSHANCLSFRVEYSDTRAADTAVELLNHGEYLDILIHAAPYKPDTKSPMSAGQFASPQDRLSLTGRSVLPNDNHLEVEALMARLMTDMSSPRGFGRSGHNQVDAIRIQEGQDVRTTIMLRNIPNKVTQADLKRYLDETSHGAYDFMYLRIDFANNCNVGYAFINFVDPLAIVPFAQARSGAKWNIHDSNKVAEISYATIQGRDCLIQKFRNSSVMLEHPSFRPKLYHTSPHQLAGQEERFPEPDNFSKMRRSIENAEHIGLFFPPTPKGKKDTSTSIAHRPFRASRRISPSTPVGLRTLSVSTMVDVEHPNDPFAANPVRQGVALPYTPTGLFAPREGQQHREEQRRRRSQFDRGTPGAEYEDSTYRLVDPALESRRTMTHQPQFPRAFPGRY